MPSAIEERFLGNLERVKGLVALYEDVAGSGRGRASVRESDILRAAVVLLHAALEDLLRSAAESKLPSAAAGVLAKIPLVGSDRKTTFTLGELSAHRGSDVDEVIRKSVISHLGRESYNNVSDIVNLMEELGLDKSLVKPYAARLASLMSRRHLIAHRADRNEQTGRGHHRAVSIGKPTVEGWIAVVDAFGSKLLGLL